MKQSIKRRTFLKSSLATASAVTAANAAPTLDLNHTIQGANDQIRVGIIGCGGQGNWDATDFQRQPNVKLVALCDVYDSSIKNTLTIQKLDAAKTTSRQHRVAQRTADSLGRTAQTNSRRCRSEQMAQQSVLRAVAIDLRFRFWDGGFPLPNNRLTVFHPVLFEKTEQTERTEETEKKD